MRWAPWVFVSLRTGVHRGTQAQKQAAFSAQSSHPGVSGPQDFCIPPCHSLGLAEPCCGSSQMHLGSCFLVGTPVPGTRPPEWTRDTTPRSGSVPSVGWGSWEAADPGDRGLQDGGLSEPLWVRPAVPPQESGFFVRCGLKPMGDVQHVFCSRSSLPQGQPPVPKADPPPGELQASDSPGLTAMEERLMQASGKGVQPVGPPVGHMSVSSLLPLGRSPGCIRAYAGEVA